MEYPIIPCGDSAVTLLIGTELSPAVNRLVFAAFSALQHKLVPGVREIVPTYGTLFIHYNPDVLDYAHLCDWIRGVSAVDAADMPSESRLVCIPVCYGGEYGPDLAAVAAHAGLSEQEVIRRHTEREYLVYMLGFLPGFAYLGGMDEAIACPRLAVPRTHIPAGSVGIAGGQTGIYPLASPGGWQLIGRTPRSLFSIREHEIDFLLSAGDRVRFCSITPEDYREREGRG
ncbi:MAG: 5-oxoprolinase subunit PxpB [Clostridia bacterium]|nr:5-oxoprolinase subunit PxpB [Clostridia bacterium]